MKKAPWWLISGNRNERDPELIQRIWQLAQVTDTFRRHSLWDHYRLSWLYQRDYYIARYGGAENALGLNENLDSGAGWLKGRGDIPSPNILRSSVETIVAWLFADQPPVAINSAGVPFELQFAVEEYGAALDSLFNTPGSSAQMLKTAHDATLSGTGYAMPSLVQGQIEMRRLAPWQVIYDPYDARDGNPRTVHVIEQKDREGVIAWVDSWTGVTGKRRIVRDLRSMDSLSPYGANQTSTGDIQTLYDMELQLEGIQSDSDRITIVHSWRTATSQDAGDGRYVVAAYGSDNMNGAVVIIDQVFQRTTLPVVPLAPMPNDEGIRGTGYGHLMRSWQEQIDLGFFKIQDALNKHGWPRLVVPNGALANVKAFADAGINVVELPPGVPGPPQWLQPTVINKEDVLWIDKILTMSQNIYGINAMMSRGASQLGANASGQALQEEHYRSLDRFSPLVEAFQTFRMRLAEEALNLLDDALAMNPEYAARYNWRGKSKSRDWADISGQFADYNISMELRGSASQTRGGRIARIQEQASQGLIDKDTASDALLDTPDVRRAARLGTAGYRLVEWQIRRILEAKSDEDLSDATPDRDTPLPLASDLSKKYIQMGRVEGAQPETLERLRNYRATADSLAAEMQRAQQAASAPLMPVDQAPAGELSAVA